MEIMSAAQRIKQRRKELELSYQQLAERTGIARSTLQRYETGNIGSIPLDKLNVLAEGLETSREYILGMPEQANAEFIGNNIYKVPVFDSASAGFGAYADSRVMCYIPTYIEHPGEKDEYLWINVKGDSMAPMIDNGDRILVKRLDSVESGSIAVVMIGDEAYVKRIKYGKGRGGRSSWLELHSVNPYYPVRRFENEETNDVRVVGLVVEVSKKL